MFALTKRKCDKFLTEHAAAGAQTHIYLAFALVDDDLKITDTDGHVFRRAAGLKRRFKGLRTSIAVEGWAFNEPPTQDQFSDMVNDRDNRATFVDSVVDFLTIFVLDGVDIDWEYPMEDGRGGSPDDYDGYVWLMANMREHFNRKNPG